MVITALVESSILKSIDHIQDRISKSGFWRLSLLANQFLCKKLDKELYLSDICWSGNFGVVMLYEVDKLSVVLALNCTI